MRSGEKLESPLYWPTAGVQTHDPRASRFATDPRLLPPQGVVGYNENKREGHGGADT